MTTVPPETLVLTVGLLTRIREPDAEQLSAAVARSLDHLRPWMPWANEAATRVVAQRERTRAAEGLWRAGTDHLYALREHEEGPLIGTFGLHRRVGPGAIEIGYWIAVDHLRRGYASAGAKALTAAALGLDDIDRVEIHTDAGNVASAAVARRSGYRLDRVEARAPEAPAETGRLQIWVTP